MNMITIATSLQCGPNSYIKISPEDLFNKLKTNPVAFEVLKDCNVKPYYDFDWEWKENDFASKEECTYFIYDFIREKFTSMNLKCSGSTMRRWVITPSGNTKLSLHFVINNAGVYSSALDFYHFKNDKTRFTQEFEEEFGCDISDVFVVGKDLFDQSVYKARNQQQKFGLVMSRKNPGEPIFQPFSLQTLTAIDDISDRYSRFFVTVCDPDVDISKPCCEVKEVIVPNRSAEMTKLRRDHSTNDVKPAPLSKEVYNLKSTTPTLKDITNLMSQIKQADRTAILSTNIWQNLISAGFGTVRAYDLNEDKFIDFCCDWSKCTEYQNKEEKTRSYVTGYKKLDKFFTFDDLIYVYTLYTGKKVAVDGAVIEIDSKKIAIPPKDYKGITVCPADDDMDFLLDTETVTETTKKSVSKLPPPTLETVKFIMNEIKAADPSYVNGDRQPWFKLISAGLGAVRTHDLNEDEYIDFCSEWCVCDKYPDAKANWKEVYKIVANAKDVTSTFGELVKTYKSVTGKSIKIEGVANGDIYDFTDEEVPHTYLDELGFTELKSVRQVIRFMLGCIYRCSTNDKIIHTRLSSDAGIVVQNTSDILTKNDSGSTIIEDTTYHNIYCNIRKSDYFKKNNTYTSMVFKPYTIHPIDTKRALNTFNGFKWKIDPSILEKKCQTLWNHIYNNFSNEKERDYVLDWLAYKVQNPIQKTCCLVIYSSQEGTGKSLFQSIVNNIFMFKIYSAEIEDLERDVLSDFNGITKDKIILSIGEMHAHGKSVSNIQKFKQLITSSNTTINQKGKDQKIHENCVSYTISTNHISALKIGPENRRFSIVDFGTKYLKNHDYFDKVHACLEDDDELEYVFNKLLVRDVRSFKPLNRISGTETMSKCYYSNLPVIYHMLYSLTKPQPDNIFSAVKNPEWKVVDGVECIDGSPSDLHRVYTSYGYQKSEKLMDLTTFGKFLTQLSENYNGFDKKRPTNGVVYRITKEAIYKIVADKIDCTVEEVHAHLDNDD